ncbi:uncharacterized protein LOC103172281 [Callorhinchus milii]|uniref:uncharacterized protein LOC103172281 n=1 Tax=Callorhinchus milii TaxID=7868 RepID=UPI0004572A7A|nr:uncharacterized protein LOC103172281 [Callorhinchus milii]|eukprot:gi/632988720/ref/XP_007883264.1/ PREDICTED: uncharacterized protein LOC103172281 [Callorhinchus milii]
MLFLAVVRSLCSQRELTRVFDQLNLIDHVAVKYSELSSAELEPSFLRKCWMWTGWRYLKFVRRYICFGILWLGLTDLGFHWLYAGCCGLTYLLLEKPVIREVQNFLGFKRYKTLYVFHHSVLQGRMNLTNVYDSLYNNILKYMSHKAGKESIIFIVDDVQDGKTAQNNIKVEQPTLSQCCESVFVFQKTEENRWNQQENHKLKIFLQTYFNTGELTSVE